MVKLDFLKSIVVKIKHHSVKKTNPVFDWQIIIVAFFLAFSVTVFFGWKLDQKLDSDVVLIKGVDKTTITINRSLMDKVVNFYKKQEELFNQDKNTYVDQADPSR